MSSVVVYARADLDPYMDFFVNQTYNARNAFNLFTYFLSTFYIALFLAGLIGNTWAISVIVSLFKTRSKEPPRNVQLYILVLCLINISVLIFIPFTVDDLLNEEFTFTKSSIVCKLYLCSELINKFLAPFVLMALSGTCYMCVCRSQCRNIPDDLRAGFAVVVLALGVLIVLVASVCFYGDLYYLVVFDRSSIDNETSIVKSLRLKCLFQTPLNQKNGRRISDFVLYTYVIGYVIPATSFTLFYGLVWRFVRRHSFKARTLVDSWRVARTVLGLVSFFLVCWTPYWIMVLYSNSKPQYKSTDRDAITLAFTYCTHLLPYINCLGFPIIYIVLNRKIKENYELIRAKRRSQILALCGGFRKGKRASGGRGGGHGGGVERTPREKSSPTKTNYINLLPIEDGTMTTTTTNRDRETRSRSNSIDELGLEEPRTSVSSRVSRSNEASCDNGSAGGSNADNQSLFANVNELIELSRHLLIPLIQINDHDPTTEREKQRKNSRANNEYHPDVVL